MFISSSNERKKIMLTCSVEWGCEHSFLRSRTFSDEILRGWTLVGSAHQITSVLQDAFCRSCWGNRCSLLRKALSSFPGSGNPITLYAAEMLLDFSQSRLLSTSCVPAMARGFPSHCLSLLVCSRGLRSLTEAQVSFSMVLVLGVTLTIKLTVMRISADKRQLKG